MTDSDAPRRIVLEGFRPVTDSIEWRIGGAYWEAAGGSAFHAGEVPHLITNDGMLAARDADVLLAACELAGRAGTLEPEISVLELGSGLGVYARQFLDRFALACAHGGHDFYDRLTFHVTDRSERMLDDIVAAGTLAPHALHVRLGMADALDPRSFTPHDGGPSIALGELRAIVHSYVLDGLAFDVVLRAGDAWMRLHYRTTLEDAPPGLAIDPSELAAGNGALTELLGLSDRFAVEQAYLPVDPAALPFTGVLAPFADARLAAGAQPHTEASFVHSHGALTSLTIGLELLRPGGFVLFHDYGGSEGGQRPDKHERFARSRAAGLNLALLDHALAAAGHRILAPDGDDDAPIHTRLVCGAASPELEDTFLAAYDLAALAELGELLREAHELRASDPDAARERFDRAQRAAPENWRVLVDWAEFELGACDDPDAALRLAGAAVAMNPTGAPVIHDVLGDAHAAIGEVDAAAAAYRAALVLHAGDVRARTGLARLDAYEGRYRGAIEGLADALARDHGGAHRSLLLGRLEQVLDMRDGAQ